MLEQTNPIECAGEQLQGEVQRFAEALGGAHLSGAPYGWASDAVNDAAALREFLQNYAANVLAALELPAIYQAYEHARRSELRELIEVDLRVAREPTFQAFAGASQFVGATELKRLRPLRDQRLVQRYLSAVEKGEANGWHTVVYGLILAVYSLPLRQGLHGYGRQTIGSFIKTARFSVSLTEEQSGELHDELCAPLAKAIEDILKCNSPMR